MYYYFRKALISTMIKNFIPIGANGVRFKDFIVGDIFTSMVRPFTSLTISFCILSCKVCLEENKRDVCTRNDNLALVISLLPYVLRFFQCLNRWYYTKMTWPHGFNALKYIGGFINTYCGWLYANKLISVYIYLTVGIIAVSYLLFWDYYCDWGLFRENDNKNSRIFLRDKLLYPKYYYYVAMIVNSILRFIWLTSLISLPMSPLEEGEVKAIIYTVLELFRRIQWSLFRVENENVNNIEKYRTILEMPLLPEQRKAPSKN